MHDLTARPICQSCTNHRPVAVNCYKNGKAYYRKQCDSCIRSNQKLRPVPPAWYRRGYRKKPTCELCGFKALLVEKQLLVYHVDGDLRNTDRMNLKTVCLNCEQTMKQKRLHWKPAKIEADF